MVRTSVFGHRYLPSEELYFKVRKFGHRDLAFALTDGGAEIAFPTVVLRGTCLRRLHPSVGEIPEVAAEHCWVFDDGCLGDEPLIRASMALKRSLAATVGVASVVASRRLRGRAGTGVIDFLYALSWREDVEKGRPLWSVPPNPEYWALAGRWTRQAESRPPDRVHQSGSEYDV